MFSTLNRSLSVLFGKDVNSASRSAACTRAGPVSIDVPFLNPYHCSFIHGDARADHLTLKRVGLPLQ